MSNNLNSSEAKINPLKFTSSTIRAYIDLFLNCLWQHLYKCAAYAFMVMMVTDNDMGKKKF